MLPKFIPLRRDFRRHFFNPKKEWQVVWGSTFQNQSVRATNYFTNGVFHPVTEEIILTFENHLPHKSQTAKGSIVQPRLSNLV